MNEQSPPAIAGAIPTRGSAIPGRAAVLPIVIFLFTAVTATPACAHAGEPVDSGLLTGADMSDCRSALHLGLQACDYGTTAQANGAAPEHLDKPSVRERALEERVDQFLASYGKPPREAVRALLEPSDDNIRSYMRKQDQTLSTAGYVAARMTVLKNEEQMVPIDSPSEPSYWPVFPQMRVSLYQVPHDPESMEAKRVLGALAREAPALRVGVKIIGRPSPRQLLEQISSIDPALSVTVATRESVTTDRLPFVRVEDLRSDKSIDIDARFITLDRLKNALAALREGASGPGRFPPLDGNSRGAP